MLCSVFSNSGNSKERLDLFLILVWLFAEVHNMCWRHKVVLKHLTFAPRFLNGGDNVDERCRHHGVTVRVEKLKMDKILYLNKL